MIDLEYAKEKFKNHVATFTDLGNIKILDFKNPESSDYRIRFLFEEDYYRLHISGDLGHLIASNYTNMTYEKFSDFLRDPGYFIEKVRCADRDIYEYDTNKAKEELTEIFNEIEYEPDEYSGYNSTEDAIDYILEHLDDRNGLDAKGYELLEDIDNDCWDYAYSLGKQRTGIIELYLMAFELASKQLKEQNHD